MTRRVSAVLLALPLLLLAACSTSSPFTVISSKNVNLRDIQIDRSESKGRVEGRDCMNIIIVIPTGGPPTIDEAIDRAVESVRADVLLNAVVSFNTFYIPYIYGQQCWNVEGDAYDSYE